MASYAAINTEPDDTDPMTASTGSLRGRRLVQDVGTRETELTHRRSHRGKKDVGFVGQASWISSVINLVNTSMIIP